MNAWKEIEALFLLRGNSQYGGECVSQQEHALQCAALAENASSSPALIVAALLHDVGHLLHDLPEDAPEAGLDDHHEASAAAWLKNRFPPAVTEPIRLHVAAKRYLCSVDEKYLQQLSAPSIVSLQLQGGQMTPAEATRFAAGPHAEAAVQLRKWDDLAKIPALPTPPFSHFAAYFDQVAERENP